MINDARKDNTNTFINMGIALLFIAIFIPPLFRWMYGNNVSVAKKEVNSYILVCDRSDDVTNGIKSQSIKETVQVFYNKDKKTPYKIIFIFDTPKNRSDYSALSEILTEEDDVKDISELSSTRQSNGDMYTGNFNGTTLTSNDTIKKYTSMSNLDSQMTTTKQYGYSCKVQES